jgi:hypothetical protein
MASLRPQLLLDERRHPRRDHDVCPSPILAIGSSRRLLGNELDFGHHNSPHLTRLHSARRNAASQLDLSELVAIQRDR